MGAGAAAQGGMGTDAAPRGSYHCEIYRAGGSCDLCLHMKETNFVTSFHFGTKHGIWKHLAHDKVPNDVVRYWIYSIDEPCPKRYVGYTTNLKARFARFSTHKSTCNSKNSNTSGLATHFKEGCPNDDGDRKKLILNFTILDFYDSTSRKQQLAGHKTQYCKCSECSRAKRLEDRWIFRLGTMFGDTGLNCKDESLQNDGR